MSFLKKIVRPIAFPVVAPFLLLKELFNNRASNTKDIINDINERKKIRDDQEYVEKMKVSRQAFLGGWGIEDNDEEINRVKKGLMFEVVSFTLVATLPVIGLVTDITAFMYWVAALTTTPFCLFFATTRLWRHECVVYGRLTPYKDWLFGDKE